MENLGFKPWNRQKISLSSNVSRLALQSTQHLIQWAPGALTSAVEQLQYEVENLTQSDAEVKNMWRYIESPPPVAFMACKKATLTSYIFYVHCIPQYIHFVTNSLFTIYKVNNVCKHINQFTSHLYKTNISVIIVTYRFLTMVVHV
jgi:hypothetical protein